MAKKDKFKQMQEGGGVIGSFQDLVQSATTVAAIERQQDQGETAKPVSPQPTVVLGSSSSSSSDGGETRYTHLPNPRIPVREYNLASLYCSTFDNMTRQDWMELAIIEKLHNDGQMPDDEFATRQSEIRNRPPRGQRKNTKK